MAIALSSIAFAQFDHVRVYSTFDNLNLEKPDTFNNGADRAGGFYHYGRFFNNAYDTVYGSWSGWSLSNMTDDTTEGYFNQYSAYTASGVSGTSNYMVGTSGAYIKFDSATSLSGAYFTNSTFAYLDMQNGSGFSKKFGGDDGTDPDYFKIYIMSYLNGGGVDTVEFYLADFRSADSTKDYMVSDWTFVDFSSNPNVEIEVDSMAFTFESSDTSSWGINTPAYFCMDDFNALESFENVFPYNGQLTGDFYNGDDEAGGMLREYLFFPNSYNSAWESWSGWSISSMLDDTTAGYENQYSCINGDRDLFFVSSGIHNEIRSPFLGDNKNHLYKTIGPGPWPMEISITNSTYAYLDMQDGSGFSKKFGGDDGNDPDYFRVKINYIDANDSVIQRDTFYLADFRFSDNSQDYILNDWITIKPFDFHKNQEFHRLSFELESSDNGMYGMNTPAYFCLAYKFDLGNISELRKAEISLYPNPTRSTFNVQASTAISQVNVYSLSGQEVLNQSYDNNLRTIKLDLSNQPNGLYFVQVQTEEGIATQKLIKQ